jgi:hypothetical protein
MMNDELTRETIGKILQENITYSGQLDGFVIHGAIDKILEIHQSQMGSAVSQIRDANDKVVALQDDIEELKKWKQSEIQLWLPILEYMHKHPELKLGCSIPEYVLKFLKERDEVRKSLKALLPIAKEGVRYARKYSMGHQQFVIEDQEEIDIAEKLIPNENKKNH